MATQDISEEDIKEFSDRLSEFGSRLPARQQALLGMILARAASPPDEDVGGHLWLDLQPALQYQLTHMGTMDWSVFQHHMHVLIHHAAALSHHVTPLHHNVPRPE